MKKLLSLLALGLTLSAGAVQAQDKVKPLQPTKMTICGKEAADRTGDERKAFITSCLKARKELVARPRQSASQSKMKICNADAGDRKGEERKKFISACLKSA